MEIGIWQGHVSSLQERVGEDGAGVDGRGNDSGRGSGPQVVIDVLWLMRTDAGADVRRRRGRRRRRQGRADDEVRETLGDGLRQHQRRQLRQRRISGQLQRHVEVMLVRDLQIMELL